MQMVVNSFLLIQCLLVSLVYGECPRVRECMKCSGDAECVLSANDTVVECSPANATQCQLEMCDSQFYTCMATWDRLTVNDVWTFKSGCLSAGTADPCDTGPICEHQLTSSTVLDTVAIGLFYCQCYGNFCNQNFLANITADPPVSDVSSTSTVGTVSMDPTPTVQLTEQHCSHCTSVSANCTLSENNRSLECFIDNECANNILQCSSNEMCSAVWSRTTSSAPWTASTGCFNLPAVDSRCEAMFRSQQPVPDSLEAYVGGFVCTCRGALCNKEFGISLPELSPSTASTSTFMPMSSSTVGTVSMDPTPTVQLTERHCSHCTSVSANCTLSENNRSLECFIDNECANNIMQCSSNEMCSAVWSRTTSSAPWTASTGCFSLPAVDSRCEAMFRSQQPAPDSLEAYVGGFVCTCRGALCNREFGISLPELSPSTVSTSTFMPMSSTIVIPVTSTMVLDSSGPIPTDITRSTVNLTSPTNIIVETDGIDATTSTESTGQATSVNVHTDGLSGDDIIAVSVSLTVVFCLIVFAILVAGFCIYARRPPKVGQREWDQPEAGLREALSQLPVEPLEIVGNGRFGTVWKAKLHEDMVACKILSFKEAKSWENERMLYCLASTAHPNILEYIGSEQKGQGYEAQYLMVLKYCPLGSLSSYLKGHTLTWNQACNFINSALAGVAHLHAESYYDAEGICREKAPIAHRDIKSSNFLVKSDSGECVLSDLGLSLQLKSNMDVSELASIGQVGTYRYMSPEALDASVNLQDPESFKQIDMYALALVLWEIASRCPAHEGDAVPEYSLPFSREVGERANPTLDAMRAIVVHSRKRPKIPESWKTHEGLSVLAESIPECWDQDPEARLTAAGVLGRMEEALEIKGPNRQKIKLIRSQAESTSSCESGSCEQTISSVSSKNCDSTEVTTEEATTVNDSSNTYEEVDSNNTYEEIIEANDDTDTHNANRAEEVTVDASEIH